MNEIEDKRVPVIHPSTRHRYAWIDPKDIKECRVTNGEERTNPITEHIFGGPIDGKEFVVK